MELGDMRRLRTVAGPRTFIDRTVAHTSVAYINLRNPVSERDISTDGSPVSARIRL